VISSSYSTTMNGSVHRSSSLSPTPPKSTTKESRLTTSDQSAAANLTSYRPTSSSVAPASYTTTTTPWFTSAGNDRSCCQNYVRKFHLTVFKKSFLFNNVQSKIEIDGCSIERKFGYRRNSARTRSLRRSRSFKVTNIIDTNRYATLY